MITDSYSCNKAMVPSNNGIVSCIRFRFQWENKPSRESVIIVIAMYLFDLLQQENQLN